MSLLGRIYVLAAVTIFMLVSSWALWTLRENATTVEVLMLIPHLDPAEPTSREIVELPVGTLLAGWLVAGGVLMLSAARAPFRIRLAARRLRRLRELEREVQQLRTLPLRQQEEDELLAAEARLDVRERRVMTQLDLSATDFGGEESDLSQLSLTSQPVEPSDDGESETRGSTP